MPLTDQHKRFIIVYNDYLKANPEGNQKTFAKKIGITQGTVSRTLSGDYPINKNLIDGVCLILGYSASWFLNGKGDKKETAQPKTLTEIQALMAEMKVLRKELQQLRERMDYYENVRNHRQIK